GRDRLCRRLDRRGGACRGIGLAARPGSHPSSVRRALHRIADGHELSGGIRAGAGGFAFGGQEQDRTRRDRRHQDAAHNGRSIARRWQYAGLCVLAGGALIALKHLGTIMHDAGTRTIDEFEIEATTSLTDRPLRTLKDGEAFVVLDSRGDFGKRKGTAEGLFYRDTRFLSYLELRLEGELLQLLSSTTNDDKATLSVNLTNPDLSSGSEAITRE